MNLLESFSRQQQITNGKRKKRQRKRVRKKIQFFFCVLKKNLGFCFYRELNLKHHNDGKMRDEKKKK
jgi:hypothetical protein